MKLTVVPFKKTLHKAYQQVKWLRMSRVSYVKEGRIMDFGLEAGTSGVDVDRANVPDKLNY